MRDLVIVGGHPGSGKTTVSSLLEKRGFARLGIDDFYQRATRDPAIPNWFDDHAFLDSAYANFKKGILNSLHEGKKVVIETTGAGNRWKALLAELESGFADQLVTIYLRTSPATSAMRIQARNATQYPIKMTPDELEKFFRLGKDASASYQHVVDANGPADEVFEAVISLIG